MSEPVVVFTTSSDIEASVVMALLDSHGIHSFRATGNPQAIWPMAVNPLGRDPRRGGGGRGRGGAAHHREPSRGRRHAGRAPARRVRRAAGAHRLPLPDRGLLEHALTHKSRAAEDASGGVADNESLEFLGDAVLGLVVADALFRQYPDYNEGQKSKIKAAVVSTQSLARHAEQMRLGEHLILGRGEEKTGGRFKQALLADAYEALIAAIYLDGGLEAADAFLRRELKEAIDAGSAQTFAPRLQVGAAGAAAGARPPAARVPGVGARRVPITARCSRRSRRGRRGARRGDRAGRRRKRSRRRRAWRSTKLAGLKRRR